MSRLEQLQQEPTVASAPLMDDLLAQLEQLPTPSKADPSPLVKGSSKGASRTFPRGTRCLLL